MTELHYKSINHGKEEWRNVRLLENRVEQNPEPQDSQTMYHFQNFALSHISKMLTKIVKHSETLKEKVTPKVKIQS